MIFSDISGCPSLRTWFAENALGLGCQWGEAWDWDVNGLWGDFDGFLIGESWGRRKDVMRDSLECGICIIFKLRKEVFWPETGYILLLSVSVQVFNKSD